MLSTPNETPAASSGASHLLSSLPPYYPETTRGPCVVLCGGQAYPAVRVLVAAGGGRPGHKLGDAAGLVRHL